MNDNHVEQQSIPPDYSERLAETWEMLLGIGQATSIASIPRRRPEQQTPFTLISGFLGSGKTTLLNTLLSQPHGFRLAVLVNDFGAINIDASLLQNQDANTISLSNGCVCCSLANGLSQTIADLLAGDAPPQAIILESSGVAEPHGVVQIALSNPALSLSGIITVVDSELILAHLLDPAVRFTVERQAAAADLLLLNKTDLMTTQVLAEIRTTVSAIAPNARILETSFGDLPVEIALGLSSTYREFRATDLTNDHRNAFASATYTVTGLIDEVKLGAFAGTLPPGVLRAKGILMLSSNPGQTAVLQVVGARWSIEKAVTTTPPLLPSRSNLVVIGIEGQFDACGLGARFDACLAT
ncbi:CobW family GTP-binding protein [Tardiphaga sp. 866_E4_N2_1]|uniref:CobW family GTP-binding protein n=1 Tax=unclassified Tardiphaga TaxID=2631404 RepID=UPI003F27A81D